MAGVFITIWRSKLRFSFRFSCAFVDQFLEMEDWDIPEQDDFESRYADELEMLDDLEEEGENQLGPVLAILCLQSSDGEKKRVS